MASSAKSATPAKTRSTQVQQYVNKHIRKATHQVRTTDLITGGTGILAFAIGFFLVATIVDAWIWPMNVAARIIACSVLVIGIFGIAITQLLPLLFRNINPQYAARMIEEAKPTFKNSLLNYLSLQKKDKKVHKAILNAVSRQAATDLSTVTVDQTIDRSGLIRMGFVLVVLSTIAIVYSMVSPKNPLQTIHRIVVPTAKIAAPASVSIRKVHPGDAKVFFGDGLEVTAEIRGKFDPETVRLVYSTEDGQQLDAVIKMKSGEISDNQFVAELQTCSSGIQQPLKYFVVAGDGRSPVYSVTVRPNPVIHVDQIRISPPSYTELPERIIEGLCEIQAIEGSKVEISATANLPIDVAFIELLEAMSDSPTKDQFRKIKTISMKPEGNKARGSFDVKMNSQRTNPRFTHYCVNFRSQEGHRNDNPNIFPIRVVADLPPEVQIIQPQQEIMSVPVNQPFTVEVEANDLDFEISEVKIFLDNTSGAIKDMDFVLTDDSVANDELGNQRVISRKTIRPIDLNWKPQEEILLHATAADNRLVNGQPDPNVSRTKNYTIKITEPTNKVIEPERNDDQESTDENQNQESDQTDQGATNNSESEGSDESDSGQGKTGKPGDDESEESSDGQEEKTGNGESENRQGEDSDQGDSENGNQQMEGQQPDSADANNDQTNSNPTENQEDPDSENSESNGQGSGEMEQDSNPQSGNQAGEGQGANTDASNDGQSNGDSGTNQGNQSEGETGRQNPGEGSNGGEAGERGGQGANPEPARDPSLNEGDIEPLSEGASEGEQMEQLQKLLENQDSSQSDPNDSQPGDSPEEGQAGTSQPSNGENNPNHQPEEMAHQNGEKSQGQEGQDQERDKGEGQSGQGQEGQDQESDKGEGQSGQGQEGQDQERDKGEGQSGQGQEGQGQESDKGEGQSGQGQEGDKGEGQSGQGQEGEKGEGQSDQGQSGQGQEGEKGEGEEGESEKGQSGQGQSGLGEQGQSSQGQSGQQDQPGNSGSTDRTPSNSNSQATSGKGSGDTRGGSSQAGGGELQGDTKLGTDEVDLEHARKATDMVLNRLREQQFEPDPELLKKMNWTSEDLAKFVQRWEQMKEKAQTGDLTAQQDYQNALLSLGLTPGGKGRDLEVDRDKMFGLREDGAVNRPPAEFMDDFNAFLKSRNRKKQR